MGVAYPSNVANARQSTRLSTVNDNEIRGTKDSNGVNGKELLGKRKSTGSNVIESSTEDEGVVVRRSPNKRRRRNVIQSSDDEDDNFASPMKKSPKGKSRRTSSTPRKNRGRNIVQPDDGDVKEVNKRSPTKPRQPRLRIKCFKITDYYGKATTTTTTRTEGKVFRKIIEIFCMKFTLRV